MLAPNGLDFNVIDKDYLDIKPLREILHCYYSGMQKYFLGSPNWDVVQQKN